MKAAELVSGYLERIAERNPEINAYLSVANESAQRTAVDLDAAARRGDPLGPLAGVPVGVKDVIAIEGMPATAGSRILEGYTPPYTATAVRRLKDAGAVVLGKLNCDEFAMGSSNENSAYGVVRNPAALDRVPGGSSGGSAAAVAAEMAAATLGTDTGGSIRQPASFCGVVGVLPTYGRVSRYGLIAFASSLDRIGPFARTVHDAATVLGVIAGHDPLDATSSTRPVPDYVAECQKPVEGSARGCAGGVLCRGAGRGGEARGRKGDRPAARAGLRITPVSLPHTRYAVPTYYVLATAEASANLERFDGVRYGYRAPDAKTLSEMYRETRECGFGAR